MAKKIDWMYARKGCATCKKAEGAIESITSTVKEKVDANKVKYGADRVTEVVEGVNTLIVVKGKAVNSINLKKEAPDADALAGYLLGPTGNLRAPTIRVGKTMVVGYDESTYQTLLNPSRKASPSE